MKNGIIKIISLCLMVALMLVCFTGCIPSFYSPLDRMKSQLENDFSFQISYNYTNLAFNGMSQQMQQQYGNDGSFYFSIERKQWDHRTDYDFSENVEYYYRYENNVMVCYMRTNDQEVQRSEISEEVENAMRADKYRIVGADTLFPAYLENFSEKIEGEEYTFTLPLDKVLEDDIYLSSFLSNVFTLCGKEYDPSLNLNILCTCITETDQLRPQKIVYDFSQIKPYVLSEGALSGEWALDTDFMYLYYEFDFVLQETIVIPNDVLRYA